MALGEEYAGLFSNNDKISNKFSMKLGKINEKVWRMPLHKNYDKLMNSKNAADVQNINYAGGAGSITAAQFLQNLLSKYSLGSFRYRRYGFFQKSCKLKFRWCNRFRCKIVERFSNEKLRIKFMKQQTLSIIKPDAVERNLTDNIKEILIKNNLKDLKEKKYK